MRTDGNDGGLPSIPLDLTHVEVDVAGLVDFRTLLALELDANLRPAAARVKRDHGMGVGFGERNAGTQVTAARRQYAECLRAATANLAGYVAAAEVLIDAMRRVSDAYLDADAGSAELNKALSDALGEAEAVRARTDALIEAREQRHTVQPGPFE